MKELSKEQAFQLGQRLRDSYSLLGLSQSDAALATGVDQSQVSRIFSGDFRRMSHNVNALCKYANVDYVENSQILHPPRTSFASLPLAEDLTGPEYVMKIFSQIWDGSFEHAQAIGGVMLATKLVSLHAMKNPKLAKKRIDHV